MAEDNVRVCDDLNVVRRTQTNAFIDRYIYIYTCKIFKAKGHAKSDRTMAEKAQMRGARGTDEIDFI